MAEEATLERNVRLWCVKNRILTYKFVSPGHKGVPDRLLVYQSRVLFLELKRKGSKPTPLQERELRIINEHGVPAVWADSLNLAKLLITEHLLKP